MFKQLKAVTTMGAMATALMASAPAFSQSSTLPSAAKEFSMVEQFWSAGMLTQGRVHGQEDDVQHFSERWKGVAAWIKNAGAWPAFFCSCEACYFA